ncbi:MAG: InlB B-repeat-containing protein [Bacteroidales bacterium]|nr:InlB B-repeat-containing protein [Bacteroidales bacterium]
MKTKQFFSAILALLLTVSVYGQNFRITFNTDGGSSVASQTVKAGDPIQVPARPTKAGVVFVGWYKDQTKTVHIWDFLNDKVTEPTTLYAKFIKVDEKNRLLNAYASPEELKNPYVAATLQTLGVLSADQRTLTLPEGTTVYIAPGVYWTDLTYQKGFPFDNSGFVIDRPNIGLSLLGANISFVGLTENPRDVHICGNRGEGGARGLGANGSWYSLAISTGFHARHITIANYAQEDLVFARDPSQNMPKRINSKNHAEVLRRVDGQNIDRIHFENVRFVGLLNMMIGLAPQRAYFKDCFIQCTDDAIMDGMINVWENCTFHLLGNHPSAGGSGSGGINVLLGCKVIGMPQMTHTTLSFSKVSRGSGATASSIYAIVNTEFLGRIQSVEWENSVREDVRHLVYNNTIGENKRPLVISPSQPQTSVTLTKNSTLNAFQVNDEYNVYNLLKGTDGWNPTNQDLSKWAPYMDLPFRFLLGVATKEISPADANTGLFSSASPGRPLLHSDQTGEHNTVILTPAPTPATSVDIGQTVWTYDRDLLNGDIHPTTGVITLTAKPNNTGVITQTVVNATIPGGLTAGATIDIRPVPVVAPILTAPSMAISENFATLSYTLDKPEYRDVSTIEWYRETSATSTNGIHIGTMKNDDDALFIDDPFTKYPFNKYDVGYFLRAVITPKYEFSPKASPVTVRTPRAITATDVTETSLFTDFRNLHIATESHLTTTGRWFFDRTIDSITQDPWDWGIGSNGTDRIWGLMNNHDRIGGTRLVFGQSGQFGDMSLVLNFSASKVEGQGFGGNGCLLDIYIKYDPITRTGYGLRVERTPASSNATTWSLYQFDETTQTPLTTGILSAVFLAQNTLTLSATGNTLRVIASTKSEKTPLHIEQDLPNTVDISWTDPSGNLARNLFGGFGFRIVNSSRASYVYGAATNNCVMLHNVRVNANTRFID